MLHESSNNLKYEKLSKEEMEKRGILGRLVGPCASFIDATRNGRKYSERLWENVFNSEVMKERIANGVCFGELGHPPDREETDMEKVCVCLPSEPRKGRDGKLLAVFDILDTPNGRILKSLCDYGSTLGVSSRGSGDLETDFDGKESVNPDTYNCEGFDIVALPAVKEARLQYVNESLDSKSQGTKLNSELESLIEKATEQDKKIMLESLDTLGMKLNKKVKEGVVGKNPYKRKYEIKTISPEKETFLLAGTNNYENLTDLIVNQAKNIYDNAFETDQRKRDFIENIFVYNKAEKIVVAPPPEADDFIEGLMSELDAKIQANAKSFKNTEITEKINPLTEDVQLLGVLKDDFGIAEQPYFGPSYILPTGEILDISKQQYLSDVEKYLVDKDLSTNEVTPEHGSQTMKEIGAIGCTPDIIVINDIKPTEEQYETLLDWIDNVSQLNPTVAIEIPTGEVLEYSFNKYRSTDIINKIKSYYASSNELEEEVEEPDNQKIDDIKEVDTADDNDIALAEELQSTLKRNQELEQQIVNLQEKLSVSYAKEMALEESVDNYKIKVVQLSNKSKETKALTEKMAKLKEELIESKQELMNKKSALTENTKSVEAEKIQLKESISKKNTTIQQLTEKLQTVQSESKAKDNKVDVLTEKVNKLEENIETLHEDHSKKLEESQQTLDKYKKIAKTSVNKYIDGRATMIGVSPQEITNRLPESYSFTDINKVCESLREYQVNINSLPFNLNEHVNLSVKNPDSRTLVKNQQDELTDYDRKLAERFLK